MKMKKPQAEEIHRRFQYVDGKLYRKTAYKNRKIGSEAGSTNVKGYRKIEFSGHTYATHSLVWAMFHGSWPQEIDHINGMKSDNRIENLRSVDRSTNMQNMLVHRKGQPIGVRYDESKNKWLARAPTKYLKWRSGLKYLGHFETKEEASACVVNFCKNPDVADNLHSKPA